MNRASRAASIIKTALFVITVFVIALPAVATNASRLYAPAISANNATAIASDAPITIPFELVTRHIMLKVKINNSRPLSFVFDTGDKVGLVDADVAKELGLKLEGQVRGGGAGAENLYGSIVWDAIWTILCLDV